MKTLRMKNSSIGVKITIIGFTILFLLNAVFNLYPVYMAIINAFKTVPDYGESLVALPNKWHFENLLKPFVAFEDAIGYGYLDFFSLGLYSIAQLFKTQSTEYANREREERQNQPKRRRIRIVCLTACICN